MTKEIRITADADLYFHRSERYNAEIAGRVLLDKIGRLIATYAAADHKFVNLKVDAIPHDNDRDYTEEDAERHLNGEPEKKCKTYAEDFFEKFPKAEKDERGLPCAAFSKVYGRRLFDQLNEWNEFKVGLGIDTVKTPWEMPVQIGSEDGGK